MAMQKITVSSTIDCRNIAVKSVTHAKGCLLQALDLEVPVGDDTVDFVKNHVLPVVKPDWPLVDITHKVSHHANMIGFYLITLTKMSSPRLPCDGAAA